MLPGPFVPLAVGLHNVRSDSPRELVRFYRAMRAETGTGGPRVGFDALRSTMPQGQPVSAYFNLRMWEMSTERRAAITPTLLAYRLHQLNDPRLRPLLRDKVRFNREYAPWLGRRWFDLGAASEAAVGFAGWLDDFRPDRIVVKRPAGQVGEGVRIVPVRWVDGAWLVDGTPLPEFLRTARGRGERLVEELLVPHPQVAVLGSRSIGTIRILTRCHPDGRVEVGHSYLRMHHGSEIDGWLGGVSCRINPDDGCIETDAAPADPFEPHLEASPTTGVPFVGHRLPYWPQCRALVEAAARRHPGLVTVGWDVVVTPSGPALLEGNDNWGKSDALVRRGQRPMFQRWYDEIRAEQRAGR